MTTVEDLTRLPARTQPADSGAAAREHALALLQYSPVYTRVARLLGVATTVAQRGGPHHETEIAARLAQLPAGWRVLHSVDADIDHLVIGPAGVFTVTICHHPDARVSVRADAFKVNGRGLNYVRDTRARAARAAALLTAATDSAVDVHGVIAVMGAQRGFAAKQQPRDVTVVTRQTITPFLHAQPAVLDAAAMERIHAVARRESTWQGRR